MYMLALTMSEVISFLGVTTYMCDILVARL